MGKSARTALRPAGRLRHHACIRAGADADVLAGGAWGPGVRHPRLQRDGVRALALPEPGGVGHPVRGPGTWPRGPPPAARCPPWPLWGRPVFVPPDAEPVFEIPWHHWNTRVQSTRPQPTLPCTPPPEPLEKHHIFPQQPELASWFKNKRIDIHAYTIPLPRSFHSWLHSGGPKGGQWNAAWLEFQRANLDASQEAIWQFAFSLMARFGVNGQLVPYHCG